MHVLFFNDCLLRRGTSILAGYIYIILVIEVGISYLNLINILYPSALTHIRIDRMRSGV